MVQQLVATLDQCRKFLPANELERGKVDQRVLLWFSEPAAQYQFTPLLDALLAIQADPAFESMTKSARLGIKKAFLREGERYLNQHYHKSSGPYDCKRALAPVLDRWVDWAEQEQRTRDFARDLQLLAAPALQNVLVERAVPLKEISELLRDAARELVARKDRDELAQLAEEVLSKHFTPELGVLLQDLRDGDRVIGLLEDLQKESRRPSHLIRLASVIRHDLPGTSPGRQKQLLDAARRLLVEVNSPVRATMPDPATLPSDEKELCRLLDDSLKDFQKQPYCPDWVSREVSLTLRSLDAPYMTWERGGRQEATAEALWEISYYKALFSDYREPVAALREALAYANSSAAVNMTDAFEIARGELRPPDLVRLAAIVEQELPRSEAESHMQLADAARIALRQLSSRKSLGDEYRLPMAALEQALAATGANTEDASALKMPEPRNPLFVAWEPLASVDEQTLFEAKGVQLMSAIEAMDWWALARGLRDTSVQLKNQPHRETLAKKVREQLEKPREGHPHGLRIAPLMSDYIDDLCDGGIVRDLLERHQSMSINEIAERAQEAYQPSKRKAELIRLLNVVQRRPVEPGDAVGRATISDLIMSHDPAGDPTPLVAMVLHANPELAASLARVTGTVEEVRELPPEGNGRRRRMAIVWTEGEPDA